MHGEIVVRGHADHAVLEVCGGCEEHLNIRRAWARGCVLIGLILVLAWREEFRVIGTHEANRLCNLFEDVMQLLKAWMAS